jgi:hypothetical protein
MPQPATERTLDLLALEIHRRVRGREGRLCWLRLTAPASQRAEVEAEIDALLARMGLDFVDVHIDADDGDPRIVEARFDQGWA